MTPGPFRHSVDRSAPCGAGHDGEGIDPALTGCPSWSRSAINPSLTANRDMKGAGSGLAAAGADPADDGAARREGWRVSAGVISRLFKGGHDLFIRMRWPPLNVFDGVAAAARPPSVNHHPEPTSRTTQRLAHRQCRRHRAASRGDAALSLLARWDRPRGRSAFRARRSPGVAVRQRAFGQGESYRGILARAGRRSAWGRQPTAQPAQRAIDMTLRGQVAAPPFALQAGSPGPAGQGCARPGSGSGPL